MEALHVGFMNLYVGLRDGFIYITSLKVYSHLFIDQLRNLLDSCKVSQYNAEHLRYSFVLQDLFRIIVIHPQLVNTEYKQSKPKYCQIHVLQNIEYRGISAFTVSLF